MRVTVLDDVRMTCALLVYIFKKRGQALAAPMVTESDDIITMRLSLMEKP